MKFHFVPYRERSVLPLERPVRECCAGKGWLRTETHTARIICINTVKNQSITLKLGST